MTAEPPGLKVGSGAWNGHVENQCLGPVLLHAGNPGALGWRHVLLGYFRVDSCIKFVL